MAKKKPEPKDYWLIYISQWTSYIKKVSLRETSTMLINDAGGERYRRMDGKNGSIAELPNNSHYSGSQRIYDLDSEYALKFRAQKQRVYEMQDMKKQIESALEKPSYALLEKLCEVINDGVENEQEQQ